MKFTQQEVINVIEDFINGKGGAWDWDDFISIKLKNSELENIRLICCVLTEKFPPTEKNQYCSSEGIKLLKKIVFELKNNRIAVSYEFEKDLKEIKQKEASNKTKITLFTLLAILFLSLIVRGCFL